MGNGVGCEYSCMGSLYFNISVISSSGRKGNLFVNVFILMFWLLSSIKLNISLWIEVGGLISF